METKGTYYKDITALQDLGKEEYQTMYSPFYNLAHKTKHELGTGTGCFKDKRTAAEHELIHPEMMRFQVSKEVMEFDAPADKYFYEAEKPLSEQNDYIKNCIFDSYSLQVLFQFEFRKLNAVIEKKISDENITDTKAFIAEEYNKFYDKKKKILLQLKDGKEFIDFITEQTATHNKDISSAFICWTGIYGMKTNDKNCEFEYLLFDYTEHACSTNIFAFNKNTNEEFKEQFIKV